MEKILKHPRVVVIGAGFGGLQAARTLVRYPVEVMLIDCNNYHTFSPLLYQVAAAELEPEDIVFPVRSIVRKLPRTNFCMSKVKGVDFEKRIVETNGPAIPYDFLILGTGSVTQFFDVPGASDYSFPLKTIEQAITLRNQILCCFERAMYVQDTEHRQRLLTFVIVGAGATGVEFAGALAELIRGPLMKDFKRLDFRNVHVVLLEATNCLLAGFPERLGFYAWKRLQQMKVDTRLQSTVSKIMQQSVRLKDGAVIPTETVVWTAGVRGDPLVQLWQLPTARNGRVLVRPTLQLADHPEVYVIGDLVHAEEDGRPLPMLAPVAVQQGMMAAQNVVRQIKGADLLPFRYRDLGAMVTIGRNAAVACRGNWTITGLPAWVVWLCVHLIKLIGFRNRLIVLINWAWDYLFYERTVRLILPAKMKLAPGISDDNTISECTPGNRVEIYNKS